MQLLDCDALGSGSGSSSGSGSGFGSAGGAAALPLAAVLTEVRDEVLHRLEGGAIDERAPVPLGGAEPCLSRICAVS